MANELNFNPYKVIAADTNDHSVDFSDLFVQGVSEYTVFCKVTTGTFKLSVGKAVDATVSPSFTVGDVIPPITLRNDSNLLFYKATSTSDVLIISY